MTQRRRVVEFGSIPQKDNAFGLAFRKLVAVPDEAKPSDDLEEKPDLAAAVLEKLQRKR